MHRSRIGPVFVDHPAASFDQHLTQHARLLANDPPDPPMRCNSHVCP
jgi:hypothetical protein